MYDYDIIILFKKAKAKNKHPPTSFIMINHFPVSVKVTINNNDFM